MKLLENGKAYHNISTITSTLFYRQFILPVFSEKSELGLLMTYASY